MAGWGALLALVPHALHHMGPLAGAALVADAGGKLLFAAVGVIASLPFLLRLQRRFNSWFAPAVALAVFAAAYTVSSLVTG